MNQNQNSTARGRFEDKGFYIILFLCVAAIGIAGYVLFSEPETDEDTLQGYEYSTEQPSVTTGQDSEPVEVPDETADSAQQTNGVQHTDSAEQTAEQEEAEQTAAASAVRPVAGEVVRVFSDDELTYDETMEDWRAHIGTDYAATAGEEVKSILGGTVSAVTQDDLYGGCVRVTDGDTELMYAGLDKISVSEGDTVSAGDVLGTAAERMAAEGAQETHIHVELRTGGAVTDPESLFVQ